MAKVKQKKPAVKSKPNKLVKKPVAKPVAKFALKKKGAPVKTAKIVKPVKIVKTVKAVKAVKAGKAAKVVKTVKPAASSAKVKNAPVSAPVVAKPLSAAALRIRNQLTHMLSDLRKDIAHEVKGASDRDLAHINDTSDMAADAADGDLSLRIAESESVEAGEIERAIEKIDTGTYGKCEVCNKPIGADRLEALPFATLCIACQELAEIRKEKQEDELDDLAEGSVDSENN